MNAEEKEELRNTVKLGVTEGLEPIWEKVRTHDTEIALLQQDAEQGKTSQVAQGERLGTVERRGDTHSMYWKIFWIGFTALAAGVAWLIGKWMFS